MSKITQSTFAKITAIFLLVVFAASFFLSTVAILILSENEVYFDDGASMRYSVYSNYVREAENEVMTGYVLPKLRDKADGGQLYYEYDYEYAYLSERHSAENSNVFITVSSSDGTVLFTNYSESESRFNYSNEWSVEVPAAKGAVAVYSYADSFSANKITDSSGSVKLYVMPTEVKIAEFDDSVKYETQEYTTETLTFTAGIRKNLIVKDKLFYVINIVDFFIVYRYAVIAVCVLSLLFALFLFIFLLCSAGHRNGSDEIYLEPQDKIPFDLYTCLVGTIILALVFVAFIVFKHYRIFNIIISFAVIAVCLLLCLLLALSLILTFATRVKYGKWWQNTVVYKILSLIFRMFRWFFRKISALISNIPLFWKTAAVFAAISLFEIIVLLSTTLSTFLMWWFVVKLVVGFILFFTVIDMKRIKKGGEEIASGNTDYKIETKNMFGDFKKHAMYLNSVSDGMQKAVNDRMKSERLKTELITNVSHDLKTPLTSIVNYVDLMKKEDIHPEAAREYLDVLDRQSKRLQKLTVDLLEASKASTGNIKINAENTDINVFLSQLSGEYAERLTQKNLELIVSSEENIFINADGRLLWRVFDNLMSNIFKYAQENTRVYVAARTAGKKVIIEFKNISKYQLNISSDELMERFVRGDQSRNTEGSGLGLSIARSLTELQGGKLELLIDGDLFKAVVTFDLYSE